MSHPDSERLDRLERGLQKIEEACGLHRTVAINYYVDHYAIEVLREDSNDSLIFSVSGETLVDAVNEFAGIDVDKQLRKEK